MNSPAFDRALLRLSAALLLVGQPAYIVITLFHADGQANSHPQGLHSLLRRELRRQIPIGVRAPGISEPEAQEVPVI